jgi:ribosomal protein L15
VRLSDIQAIADVTVDLAALKAAGVVPQPALRAKVILAGAIKRKVLLKGLLVSKGARAAIEAVGGSVELPPPAQPAAAPKAKGEAAGGKPAPEQVKGK